VGSVVEDFASGGMIDPSQMKIALAVRMKGWFGMNRTLLSSYSFHRCMWM
jgi:hypothetical protein